MAIGFDGTNGQLILWPFTGLNTYATRSYFFWCVYNDTATTRVFANLDTSATDFQGISINSTSLNKISLTVNYSTADKVFECDTALSAGTVFSCAITYDNSSGANVPVMYTDGAARSVTTVNAGSGSLVTGDGGKIYLGDSPAPPINGTIYNFLIYNRIAAASEIASWHASKLAIPDKRGLIFAPQLWGNAGNVGEGGIIAAGNTIADNVSGALGVAAGSPLFRGDTVLTFGG